jgi:hypothetical protein
MDRTAEVRWFASGRSPSGLKRRMDDLGAKGPERRRDDYLILPETEALGVKLRDGGVAFELKLRDQDLGEAELPGGVIGRVELWRKWSFPPIDEEATSNGLGLPARAWLVVDKARTLIDYPYCQVELAELRAAGEEWWTLSFEASGGQPVEALTAAVAEFFGGSTLAEDIRGACSCAYPAWLQSLSG